MTDQEIQAMVVRMEERLDFIAGQGNEIKADIKALDARLHGYIEQNGADCGECREGLLGNIADNRAELGHLETMLKFYIGVPAGIGSVVGLGWTISRLLAG